MHRRIRQYEQAQKTAFDELQSKARRDKNAMIRYTHFPELMILSMEYFAQNYDRWPISKKEEDLLYDYENYIK